jgi:3-phosphoshikimate 1-carboxyvinyltransferase
MLAALSDGTTILTNALIADDSLYFASSLRQLGFEVQPEDLIGRSHLPAKEELKPTLTVRGQDGRIPASQADLYVGNAGTAARFLSALLSLGYGKYTLDGNLRMRQRPMKDLLDSLKQLGAVITQPDHPQGWEGRQDPEERESGLAQLPIYIQASGLAGGQAQVTGRTSSQFLSALLMVAPYARQAVELNLEHDLTSRPFVDMTLGMMADFGVQVERQGYERFLILPQKYHSPGIYAIEGDATTASYFFCAPALCGGTLRVEGITRRSRQGDIAFLDILEQMGCTVSQGSDWVTVSCSPENTPLRGLTVDMVDIPDTAQTLAAIAPFACTPTTIRGIASARRKESDRVAALCTELARLGVGVEEHQDGLTIHPCKELHPAEIHTYHDHRMAMAFSMIGLKVPGITILEPSCVSKTFPGFYEVLAQLRR